MFLVQEEKVKLPLNKSYEKHGDIADCPAFVYLNFFGGLIFVNLLFRIFKHLEPYQASMMKRLSKIVSSF